jgi:hypothetical protein
MSTFAALLLFPSFFLQFMPQPLLVQPNLGHPALFGQQARHWLLVLLAVLGSAASALAQTTVTIGSTTIPVASPATSSYFYGPIYRSSATSSFNYSRYAHLYTAAELGIPAGAAITQLEWLKADAGAVTGANTLNVLLGNSTAATLADGTTWGTLTTGATSAYTNTAQDVTGAAGTYLTVPTTGFTYTGGNLLVLSDWTKGGTATGVVNFVTNPATGLAIGTALDAALTNSTALNTTSYGNRRPTLRITYTGGTVCTAPPTAGTATASASSVCAGSTVALSLSGVANTVGLTVQWQASATGAAGSYTNITGATGLGYTTPALSQTTYYQAVVTCSGQSATSVPVQVTVLTPTYATLPYTQGFESAWLSRCNTSDVPDASWLNTPTTGNNSWRRNDDATSAGWGSANGAYTPGGSNFNGASSTYSARFHSYNATSGLVGSLDYYVNLSAAGSKRLVFDYINTNGTDKLSVFLSTDGGATFGTTALTQQVVSATWTQVTVDFTSTSATSVLRFQATSDFGTTDIGLDNVGVLLTPAIDVQPTALVAPAASTTTSCYSSTEAVTVTVRNGGGNALDFAANPVTVTVAVTGAVTQTLTTTVSTNAANGGTPLAVGATVNITLPATLNMTTVGTYTLAVTATATGDGNTTNDVLGTQTRTVAAPVAGTLTPAATSICVSGTATLTLTGAANGSIQFQSSTSATGTFTDIAGATSATFTTPVLTTTTYYRAQVRCNTGTATSNVSTITVNNPLVASTNTPVTACAGSTATLTATASAGATLRFFDTATGGTALATGSTFTTPALTASRQYFVEASTGSAESVGRPSPAATTSISTSNYGLVFTATSAFTLTSVDVYPAGSAGNLVVQVQDNTGALIPGLTATVALPAGTGTTAFTVPLNFSVPAGTGLRLIATSSPAMVREASVGGFPYTSLSGAVSITNGYISGTSTTYYYFYNWQVSTACIGATRTAIQVNVNPTPARPTLTPTYNGTTTTLTSSAATGNQFYFNGVAIAGATGQTYVVNGSATTYGSYTVVVTNSAGCSSAASVVTVITTTRAGIAGASLLVYPNPTPTGQVTLELSGFRSATQLAVIDALGRVVSSQTLPATTGVVTHTLNLTGMASGVYMLRLTNADGVETRHLVRE